VSRYSRYYAQANAGAQAQAQTSKPGSTSASPERGDDTVYRAYRPAVVALTSPLQAKQMQMPAPQKGAGVAVHVHKREVSTDSITSQGSAELASEYQREMPEFEHGYAKWVE
jgi:hypothetical protein